MKKTKFSEGIEKRDGKFYQTTTIEQIEEYYVSCPYCGDTTDVVGREEIVTCSMCKKVFLAKD